MLLIGGWRVAIDRIDRLRNVVQGQPGSLKGADSLDRSALGNRLFQGMLRRRIDRNTEEIGQAVLGGVRGRHTEKRSPPQQRVPRGCSLHRPNSCERSRSRGAAIFVQCVNSWARVA